MLELRFHGRGGQGTVSAAKILADAVLRSGRGWCMAIPEFGVERRGAPVLAYARVSKEPIRTRCRIYRPDVVVILDTAAVRGAAPLAGLKPGGAVVVNCERGRGPDAEDSRLRVFEIPAASIALARGLGPPSSPLVNTAMAGAVCALFDLADEDAVAAAVRETVPAKLAENEAAAREGYRLALKLKEAKDAQTA